MKHKNYLTKFLSDEVNLNETRIARLEKSAESVTDYLKGDLVGYRKYSKQGSYASGTIIKPVDTNDEFDADILVLLKDDDFDPNNFETDYVDKVYQSLKKSGTYKDKIKRNTRCVTVEYKGDFHLDVVPCIEYGDAFYICNRKDKVYERTDGDGYRKWLTGKNTIGGGNNLRKSIRLLKYLRDYKNTFSIKSILLTTLLAYRVEDWESGSDDFCDLPTTLKTLLNRLDDFLQANPTMPIVSNPVLPSEDFNRHWDQAKYENFRDMINSYTKKVNDAFFEEDPNESVKKWREIFGGDFGELKEDPSRNSRSCDTRSVVPPLVVPATKPYAYVSGQKLIEYKPQDFPPPLCGMENELKKLEKDFPSSQFNYQKEKNQVTVDFIIDPCCYVAREEGSNEYDIVRPPPKGCKEPVAGGYRISVSLTDGRVFELDKKIEGLAIERKKLPIDLHLNSDKSCCLTLDVEKINWLFSDFFLKRVYPYFVWQAYYAKYDKVPPCGEYPHGREGMLEAIEDCIGRIGGSAVKGVSRNAPCPSCGSGKKYKNCCLYEDQKKDKERLRRIKMLSALKGKVRYKKEIQ